MNSQKNKIYFGFFKDFHAPTILFSGNPSAFALFARLLRDGAKKLGVSTSFKDTPLFVPGNVEILLQILPQATGMKKVNDEFFEWGLGVKECELFAEELDNFASAESGDAFHQYLACSIMDDVEVVASTGEYEPSIFNNI